jgi:phosphatidylserine decarboxylase
MSKWFFIFIQYLLPQHLVSICMGKLADCTHVRFKNWAINYFIHLYDVDLTDAVITKPEDYATFNDFFIRQLKSTARPIAADQNNIACPTDGTIAEIGSIARNQLLQAKNSYFTLESLLGQDSAAAESFMNGQFATLYLAPNNYHRIHMPIDATLLKAISIPGKLFSVNRMTAELIPNLYSRNERLVCLFDTAAGPMAVILVGAMIVGSMQTIWMQEPIRSNRIVTETLATPIRFKKGDELGYFKLGSTVILLFAEQRMSWLTQLQSGTKVQFGESLGTVSS